jgi:hypothetical protein
MKRSEMIEKLAYCIQEGFEEELWSDYLQAASDLINHIEVMGMLPPMTDYQEENRDCEGLLYCTPEDLEWEPEDMDD